MPRRPDPDPLAGLPVLLSVEAASRLLGWSASKGWRLAQRGQFPAATRVGARWYVRTALLRRWLAGLEAGEDATEATADAGSGAPGGLRLVAGDARRATRARDAG